jgi:cytochrome c oxidase subunit II
MGITRRTAGLLLVGAGAGLLAGPFVVRLFAASTPLSPGQDQAPNRPEFTLLAKHFHYSPGRIEVTQDDLVKLTVRSEDLAHSFAIDEYRIMKRVPAGGSTTFEFRADRAGTFRFYCNLTSDGGHSQMHGELVVRPK